MNNTTNYPYSSKDQRIKFMCLPIPYFILSAVFTVDKKEHDRLQYFTIKHKILLQRVAITLVVTTNRDLIESKH